LHLLFHNKHRLTGANAQWRGFTHWRTSQVVIALSAGKLGQNQNETDPPASNVSYRFCVGRCFLPLFTERRVMLKVFRPVRGYVTSGDIHREGSG